MGNMYKGIDLDAVSEPQVVKSVLDELDRIGSDSKKNIDELKKNFEDLKKVNERPEDALKKEHLEKLSSDISVRQDEIDKKRASESAKINERIDSFEVALKRIGAGSSENSDQEFKDAREFFISNMSLDEKGATFERTRNIKVDTDLYKKYKESFVTYLRKNGDERNLSPEEHKTLSVGIDPDGGYTVTPAMSNMIIKRVFESDPIRQLASTQTITTSAIEWMVDWTEPGSGWETETIINGETDTPKWYKVRIPVHILSARPRATQMLLEDSGINIESWLANSVGAKFSRDEAAAFVTGTGIGQPRGFLTYGDGTTFGTIEQVHMGAAATLTADGFIDVKYHLKEQFLGRGTWLMNRTTVMAAMKLKDGAGDYIWKPGLTNDAQSNLLGLPVRMSTTMPAVAANALAVALGDWREGYMIVDRLGITVQRDPYTQKPFVEFYTRKRVGADVINFDAIKIGTIEV